MAIKTLNSRHLRFGFWGKINVTQPQSAGDFITISDSIAYRILVKISDSIGLRDTNPARQYLTEVIVFFEELSARVKGKIQTLFISDDRYFRKRG
jgi:hypothetical protein